MSLLKRLFKHRKRKELRFVTYRKGERLLSQGWRLAKKEDKNQTIGMVYVELLDD